MSPAIVEALTKLQLLEQATVRINNQQAAAAGGAHAHARAQAELAEQAGLAGRALDFASEHARDFGQELLHAASSMVAGFVGVEAVIGGIEKVTEAAREAERANRVLTARFGASASEYREFSEAAAQGTNFTAIQFERAAATLQPLTRDYGLTNEELQALIRNTADLATASGVDLVQASSMVAGVMRGQTRAGNELGLNLRANVIAGMAGLSDADKRAAVEGDNVASAHARLNVVALRAAEVHGQAAAAAGAEGDSFARLDKATADMYETMAKTGPVKGLAAALADLATAADHALAAEEGLSEGYEYGGRLGAQFRAEQAAARAATAAASLALTSAQATGMTGTPPPAWQGWSGGVPPQDWRTATERVWEAQQVAVRSLTSAEAELARKTDDYAAALKETASSGADLFTRHTQGADDVATAWTRAQIEVNRYELQLKQLGSARGQIGSYEQQLEADRTLRRQLGLPELPGETATIRELLRVGYKTQLAEGPAALAAALAHLKLGDWDSSRVAVQHQDVTVGSANIVVQSGAAGGGGRQSSISGSGLPAGGRYGAARTSWDPRTMGIGRAIG